MARSNGAPRPAMGRGPVPIETQKHVPAGSLQLTATTKASARRTAYDASANRRPSSTVSWMPSACRSHGADPEHGVGPHLMLLAPGLHRPGVVAKPAPDHLAGRKEHRLHRLGTVGVAEDHAVVATTQSVGPRGLLVAPVDGQVGDLADGSVVDRPVLDHRPDHGVATSRQHVHERLQPRKVEGPVIARSDTGCGTGGGMFGGRHPSSSRRENACRGRGFRIPSKVEHQCLGSLGR